INTRMERAYCWYQKLYDRKKKGMDADYLFKYAQALKGVGKYGRARRMMRIHDKKNGGLESMVKGNGIGKEMALGNTLTTRPNIVLKNVSINSIYSDFAPMFYKEDEIVYSSAKDFRPDTKRYKKNNPPFLDLYVAKVAEGTQDLNETSKFSNTINTEYHEAVVSFSADRTTMYFTRNNYEKGSKGGGAGLNNLKIYGSKNIEVKWTEAEGLPFNNDRYST